MARQARLKVKDGQAWYHLYASVATHRGDYPLQKRLAREHLLQLVQFYAAAYCVRGNIGMPSFVLRSGERSARPSCSSGP